MLGSMYRTLAPAALVSALGCASAFAQHSTTITYQGSLAHQGEPYTGTADFAFRLWNAEVDGQVASPILLRGAVEVDGGLFQIPLEFNAEHLQGDRWMVISVRTPAWDGVGSAPPYTQLPGRQRITASPYSVQTRGVFVNEAGNRVGIGTTAPEAALHVAGEVRADGGVRFPGGGIHDVLVGFNEVDFGPMSGGGVSGFSGLSVPGATPGDFVLIQLTPHVQGLGITEAWVASDGLVSARVRNNSAGMIDAPLQAIRVMVIKP